MAARSGAGRGRRWCEALPADAASSAALGAKPAGSRLLDDLHDVVSSAFGSSGPCYLKDLIVDKMCNYLALCIYPWQKEEVQVSGQLQTEFRVLTCSSGANSKSSADFSHTDSDPERSTQEKEV